MAAIPIALHALQILGGRGLFFARQRIGAPEIDLGTRDFLLDFGDVVLEAGRVLGGILRVGGRQTQGQQSNGYNLENFFSSH